MFVRFYTLTGVSPRDTPHNATLPGPCYNTTPSTPEGITGGHYDHVHISVY